ncbi:hypothetical protein JG687_00008218 [Phytophthora cactorum]|uniref:Uncharacterized protein n=1 Tax=Phytophthora cactorum TaxID=29920 RepID=A0A8T1UEK6_9STRA|nr:hypothetical protein JG687_00008218 [Phytophthora cactorum]
MQSSGDASQQQQQSKPNSLPPSTSPPAPPAPAPAPLGRKNSADDLNLPLRANAPPAAHVAPQDVDARARLLSQKIAAMDASQSGAAAAAAAVKPQSGSYGSVGSSEPATGIKKAQSYQALADLEKKGYFPVAPKPSALGVQRGLKDSVVNDMCRAVVKHMVGDVYVSASGSYGQRKVLNHLYEPVFASVQAHFRRLPARYALSVNPDDVPLHMRLLAQNQRDPTAIAVNAQLKKDDNGEIVPNVCEVVVVSLDRENILDAITRALTTMKGNILDADVMTTSDGTLLDRFVVKGSFMSEERQEELRTNIEQNLRRLSMEEDTRPSATSTQDSGVKENVSLAEKLGVLQMVDKNEIKAEWKLDLNEVRLEKAVGSGRSGSTYSAWWRGTHVAAKVVDSSTNTQAVGEELLNEFHREVAVVSKLRHPNIVLFLGAAINPPLFEFMENGTLTDLIRGRRGPIDFFRLVAEMAMGMNYLHLCSIMHRDLKSGNVLIDSHGTAKISDFGLSCVLEIGSSSDLTAETGTYRWMAPEVIRHEPYSSKADVYSFGIVLWELLARDQPFRGLTPIQAAFAVARQQMRPALPRQTPQKIGELIEHCWHHDPARRPDFGAILEALPLVKRSLKKRDFKNMGIFTTYPTKYYLRGEAMGCCAKCFGCAVLTQLIAVGCLLAIIPAAYLSYDYYLKPWAEDHYDEAVAAAKTVASRAASAAADIDTSELSCGDCLGVNLEYPISGLNSDYSSFQISLMNDAGKFLSAVTSSGVAIAGIAVFGSTLVGVLASASAMPSTNSGLFELTLMIAQGQFITLLGSINLEGVPGFFIEFCTKFAWTNLHIFPTSTTTKTTDATTARQRQLSSGGTDSSLGGVTRYAKTLGVDPDYLFYYTLMVLLAVCGLVVLLYLISWLVLRIFKKEDRPLAQMLNNRVVWVSIQLSLLLQYSLAMTSCFQISYSVRNNRSTGGLILAAIILTTSCLGLAVFGICILSRYKHELVDHGTEGHEKKPFNHRYGSFYQDFTKENRFFFLAKMALDVASGAVVGAGNRPMVQLGLLVAFNTIFIIAMVVRRPYLLRVFYVIGLLTSYLRIVMLLLTLVLVSSELVPQRIRDLISQIIICVNSLVLLCLFARVGYAAAKAMTKWLQNRKEAQAGANESDDSADLLPVEILENGGQRHVSLQRQPQSPPADGTPPSAQAYHQTTDRFPSPVPPYPPLVMADSERDRLEFLAHRLIHKALEDYDVHRQNGAKVDARSWKLVRKSDQLAMYKRAEPSSLYQSPEAATAIRSRAESASIIESSITQGRPRQKMPILLQVGAIQGTLNEVMYGTIAVDGRGMMLKTAYTDDTLLDGETLCQLRGPSATHPFRFLGVKWVVKGTPHAPMVRPRDIVFLEATGILTREDNNERVGYHLMHSVSVPGYGPLDDRKIVRGQISSCILYTESPDSPAGVDVFMKARFDPNGNVSESVATQSAALALILSSPSTFQVNEHDSTAQLPNIEEEAGFCEDWQQAGGITPWRESAQEEFMARIIAMRNAAEDAYRTTRKTAQAQFEQLSKAHNGFSHGQDSFSVQIELNGVTKDGLSCVRLLDSRNRWRAYMSTLHKLRYAGGVETHEVTISFYEVRAGKQVFAIQLQERALRQEELARNWSSITSTSSQQFLLDEDDENNNFVYHEDPRLTRELDEFCDVDSMHTPKGPVILLGESGMGKSAFLANWLSCSVSNLLERILREIKEYFELNKEIPDVEERLSWQFPRFLEAASKKGRVILVVDGLHRLHTNNGESILKWVPLAFPPNVRIIFSGTLNYPTAKLSKVLNVGAGAAHTIPRGDDECGVGGDFYEKTSLSAQMIERIKMEAGRRNWKLIHVLPLAEEDRRRIVKKFISKNRDISYQDHSGSLRKAGLQLFEIQQNAIVGVPMSASPHFLKNFLTCLLWAVKEGFNIHTVFESWLAADSVAQLLESVLRSMEIGYTPDQVSTDDAMEFLSEFDGEDNISADTASAVSSRKSSVVVGDPGRKHSLHQDDGRTKIELARAAAEAAVRETSDSLRVHDSQDDDTSNPGLNEMKRVKSVHETKEVFVNMEVVVLPMCNDILRDVIWWRYIGSERSEQQYHQWLIRFFRIHPTTFRRVEELPWHLKRCYQWDALRQVLVNLPMFQLLYTASYKAELFGYWKVLTDGPLLNYGAATSASDPPVYVMPFDVVKEYGKSIDDWYRTHFQDYPQSEWDLKQSYNHRVVLKLQALYDTVKTEVMQKQKYLRDVKRKTRETSRRYELAMRECDMAKHAAEEMSSRLAKLEHVMKNIDHQEKTHRKLIRGCELFPACTPAHFEANKKELRLLSMKLKDLQDEKKVLHTKKTHLQNEELPILRKTIQKATGFSKMDLILQKFTRREELNASFEEQAKLYEARLKQIKLNQVELEEQLHSLELSQATTSTEDPRILEQNLRAAEVELARTEYTQASLVTSSKEVIAGAARIVKLIGITNCSDPYQNAIPASRLWPPPVGYESEKSLTSEFETLEPPAITALLQLCQDRATLMMDAMEGARSDPDVNFSLIAPDSSSRGRRRTVRGGDEKTTTRSSRYRRPPQLSSVAEKSKDKEKDKDRVGFDRGAVPPLAAAIGAVMAAMATQPNTPELEEGEQEPREEAEVLSRETIKASSRNKLAQRKRVNSSQRLSAHLKAAYAEIERLRIVYSHAIEQLEVYALSNLSPQSAAQWYEMYLRVVDLGVQIRRGEIRHRTTQRFKYPCMHKTGTKGAVHSGALVFYGGS